MFSLRPNDSAVLAEAVTDSLVVAADDVGRDASVVYWLQSRPWVQAVVDAAARLPEALGRLAHTLMSEPAGYDHYHSLRCALRRTAEESPGSVEEIFDVAWRAEQNSRLGYRIGPGYRADAEPVGMTELEALSERRGLRRTSPNGPVLVVIPFRDDSATRTRLRNLLSCLLALADQTLPRNAYRVAVVETDARPRWSDVLQQFCDHYIFAEYAGPFNRAWATNVGVLQAPDATELVCIFDADILADREFLERNVRRFMRPGVGAVLPYRDMSCLDEVATAMAIRDRLMRRVAADRTGDLRAFEVRRPPGACMWVRAEAFRRVGGLDERYEGWGGEDNDFAFRIDLDTPIDHYNDLLLHQYHPSSAVPVDGEEFNSHIPPLSWSPQEGIGNPRRYVAGP